MLATSKKLIIDTGIYFFGKGIAGLSGFLIVPILIRGMNLNDYGQYALWLLVTRWIVVIAGGWLQQSILRYYSEYQNSKELNKEDWWGTIKYIWMVLSFIVSLAVFSTAYLAKLGTSTSIVLAMVAFLQMIYSHSLAIAQSEIKPVNVILGDSISNLILTLGLLLLMFMERMSLLSIFIIYCLSYIVGIVFFFRGITHKGNLYIDIDILKRQFLYGYPYTIWFSLSLGQLVIGRLILEINLMGQESGIYSAFMDFSIKVGTLFFMPVVFALHARIMNHNNESLDRIHFMRNASLIGVTINLVIVLFSFITYPLIKVFLFGEIYLNIQHGRIVFLIIALGVALNNLGLIAHKPLEIQNKTLNIALLMGLSTFINLVSSAILVNHFGILGVSIGWLLGTTTYLVLTVYLSSKTFSLRVA